MIKLFEIGMYNGGTADLFIEIFERLGINYEVYGFEPAEDMYDFLMRKYVDNPKVKVFNVAVSNFEGDAYLYNTPNKDGRTLCVTKWNAKKDEFELCKTIKFSEWFNGLYLFDKGDKDFYIIDCNIEGSEYEFYADLMDSKIVQYIDIFTGSLGDLYKIGKDNESIELFLSRLKDANIVVHELTINKLQNLGFIEDSVAKLCSMTNGLFIPPKRAAMPGVAKFDEEKPWFIDMNPVEEPAPVKNEVESTVEKTPVKNTRKKRAKKG